MSVALGTFHQWQQYRLLPLVALMLWRAAVRAAVASIGAIAGILRSQCGVYFCGARIVGAGKSNRYAVKLWLRL